MYIILVPLWYRSPVLGTNYLKFEWSVPKTKLQSGKGFIEAQV